MKNKALKIVTISLFLAACGGKGPSKTEIKRNTEQLEVTDPGSGYLNNTEYNNEFFQFRLPIPADWHADLRTSFNDTLPETKNQDSKLTSLCTINKYTSDELFEFNPSLIALSENVAFNSDIQSGVDYLKITRTQLLENNNHYTVEQKIQSEIIGGLVFEVLSSKVNTGYNIQQDYYCAVHDGYALIFILTYNQENDKGTLLRCLHNINFY